MPQHKSCIKRVRTSADARLRNRNDRSRCRTMEKAILGTTSKSEAQASLVSAYELFDRMVSKGVLHRNTAARQKAKLSRHVNSLAA
ncbi:30S ribosomal protein S20 [candidate division KSB1 bacterium]|nr:30S ribosomal protein S20 [candidate division KSB1 bacterium]